MVSSLLQLGIAQSFSKPLHAAVASTAASGEKATAATGRSSAISENPDEPNKKSTATHKAQLLA